METATAAERFETWAIVEVMGHKKLAGYVSEQSIAGAALVRVDVPATDPEPGERADWYGRAPQPTIGYTKLLGVASIYALTPCTEEVARRAARVIERGNEPLPVSLPVTAQLPASTAAPEDAEAELVGADEDTLPY